MKQCKKGPKRSCRKKPEELRSSVTWASLSSSITSRGNMREIPGAVTHGNRLPWPRPASQRPKRPIGSSRNRGNTSARCSARQSTTWMISGLLRCNKSLNRTPWCGRSWWTSSLRMTSLLLAPSTWRDSSASSIFSSVDWPSRGQVINMSLQVTLSTSWVMPMSFILCMREPILPHAKHLPSNCCLSHGDLQCSQMSSEISGPASNF